MKTWMIYLAIASATAQAAPGTGMAPFVTGNNLGNGIAPFINSSPLTLRTPTESAVETLATGQFVSVNGEFRVCRERDGARTFVLENLCLWEMPLDKSELQGQNSVAGLKVERAATESLESHLQRKLPIGNPDLLSAELQDQTLLIHYRTDTQELASR